MRKGDSGQSFLTEAIVARRVNFGETDRIVELLTPQGKISAMAKGARREKSKLAGGIEPFSLSKVTLVTGRGDLYTLSSAKMVRFFQGVLVDMEKLEFAGEVVRKVARVMGQVDYEVCFDLLKQTLEGVDDGLNMGLIRAWFWLNLARISGDEVNLFVDVLGEKLTAEKKYAWNFNERCFEASENGFDAEIVKMMKVLLSVRLGVAGRVRGGEKYYGKLAEIGLSFA